MTQSELLRSIRQYFWRLKFTEVEVSYLNSSLPLEPNIYSFKTTWTHQNQQFYLPTSPESALKKFLAQSSTNCFAISHCFRDLENSGPGHTPEFLMLEWYEVNKNLNQLLLSTQKFIRHFLPALTFQKLTLPQNLPQNEPDFNQYFLNKIEPNLPRNGGVFITGYPAFLSPLAKTNHKTASRFELYINSIEIANGCIENRDPVSIKKAFDTEKAYRLKKHLPLHPASTEFIQNCASLPPCSGIGLGLDRLLAIINL